MRLVVVQVPRRLEGGHLRVREFHTRRYNVP